MAGPAPAAGIEWTSQVALEERYDDNITRLSGRDLDRLESSGGGTGLGCGSDSTDPNGHRFSITTPDDLISIPQLSSTLRTGWLAGRPTAFGLDISAYQYARNPIKNYQSYRLSASQPLHRETAHSTLIGVSYAILPSFYLRNLRSNRTSQEFADQGIFVLPPPRREATFREQTADLRIDQEILPDRLRFRGAIGSERRDFNRCFDERDSRMLFREASLAWYPPGGTRWRLRLSYRRENLRAQGDLADTPVFTEPDISSRRKILEADTRLSWKNKRRSRSVRFGYETERRDYGASDPNDILHFGRADKRRQVTLAALVDVKRGWTLTMQARRETNKSSFPSTPGSTFEPDDVTDYRDTLLQVGFAYGFSTGPPAAPSGNSPRSTLESRDRAEER